MIFVNNVERFIIRTQKLLQDALFSNKNKVLLCKRAIEPRYGLWTLPAGFMENGETVAQAALRETWEEARATLILINSTSLHQYQELVRYTCCIWHSSNRGQYDSGPESLETRLFSIDDIPWDELAFHTVRDTLIQLKQDLERGSFPHTVLTARTVPHLLGLSSWLNIL